MAMFILQQMTFAHEMTSFSLSSLPSASPRWCYDPFKRFVNSAMGPLLNAIQSPFAMLQKAAHIILLQAVIPRNIWVVPFTEIRPLNLSVDQTSFLFLITWLIEEAGIFIGVWRHLVIALHHSAVLQFPHCLAFPRNTAEVSSQARNSGHFFDISTLL
jgi:hypothetical protein